MRTVGARPPNADQLRILDFLRHPTVPAPVDTNPVARALAAVLLDWDAQARCLTVGFTASAEHLQGNGAVHGGVLATMLDFGVAFATLACLAPPRVAVTATLHLQYERALRAPAAVRVQARVDRLGGRMAFASALLVGEDAPEGVIARASASLALTA